MYPYSGSLLKGAFNSKLLSNPLASSFLYILTFYYHILQFLI